MIFFLEFYHQPQQDDVSRIRLAIQKLELGTAERAQSYARGAIENVVFDGRMAHSCCVRDHAGALICVVTSHVVKPVDVLRL